MFVIEGTSDIPRLAGPVQARALTTRQDLERLKGFTISKSPHADREALEIIEQVAAGEVSGRQTVALEESPHEIVGACVLRLAGDPRLREYGRGRLTTVPYLSTPATAVREHEYELSVRDLSAMPYLEAIATQAPYTGCRLADGVTRPGPALLHVAVEFVYLHTARIDVCALVRRVNPASHRMFTSRQFAHYRHLDAHDAHDVRVLQGRTLSSAPPSRAYLGLAAHTH